MFILSFIVYAYTYIYIYIYVLSLSLSIYIYICVFIERERERDRERQRDVLFCLYVVRGAAALGPSAAHGRLPTVKACFAGPACSLRLLAPENWPPRRVPTSPSLVKEGAADSVTQGTFRSPVDRLIDGYLGQVWSPPPPPEEWALATGLLRTLRGPVDCPPWHYGRWGQNS